MISNKEYSKRNLVKALNFNNSKIILILLTKVVAFYLRIFAPYVYGTGFQGLILDFSKGGKSSNLQNNLENPL